MRRPIVASTLVFCVSRRTVVLLLCSCPKKKKSVRTVLFLFLFFSRVPTRFTPHTPRSVFIIEPFMHFSLRTVQLGEILQIDRILHHLALQIDNTGVGIVLV